MYIIMSEAYQKLYSAKKEQLGSDHARNNRGRTVSPHPTIISINDEIIEHREPIKKECKKVAYKKDLEQLEKMINDINEKINNDVNEKINEKIDKNIKTISHDIVNLKSEIIDLQKRNNNEEIQNLNDRINELNEKINNFEEIL